MLVLVLVLVRVVDGGWPRRGIRIVKVKDWCMKRGLLSRGRVGSGGKGKGSSSSSALHLCCIVGVGARL